MQIRQAAVDDMIAHARQDAPDECCGLLVARDETIVRSVRVRNLERSPARYRVDPAGHFALIRALRNGPERIAGAYHSHPRGPATPSASDLAEAYDPDLLYVIVSLEGDSRPDVRGFRIQDGNFLEIPLVPLP